LNYKQLAGNQSTIRSDFTQYVNVCQRQVYFYHVCMFYFNFIKLISL